MDTEEYEYEAENILDAMVDTDFVKESENSTVFVRIEMYFPKLCDIVAAIVKLCDDPCTVVKLSKEFCILDVSGKRFRVEVGDEHYKVIKIR